MQTLSIFIVTFLMVVISNGLDRCEGDTRPGGSFDDFGKCNHDQTHRVCAKIGDANSSFWKWTGQQSWCGSSYITGATNWEGMIRCPPEKPTWCICKWATEKWINGVGCNQVEIDCQATDVCDLKTSYIDGDVELHKARECIESKCPTQWNACS